MTRARLAAVAASALTLAAAWAALPRLIGLAGLGRYDLLLRVLLILAALSLAETLASRLTGWLKAHFSTQETPHDQ